MDVARRATAPSSYTYDANGKQLSAGTTTYAYDLADCLASATAESPSWSGDGLRRSAAAGPQAAKTVRYLVDRTLAVAIERDGANKLLRRYLCG